MVECPHDLAIPAKDHERSGQTASDRTVMTSRCARCRLRPAPTCP